MYVNHPTVGALELDYEAMEQTSDPGLAIVTYFAEPDSPTAERLTLPASWAATSDRDTVERTAQPVVHENR